MCRSSPPRSSTITAFHRIDPHRRVSSSIQSFLCVVEYRSCIHRMGWGFYFPVVLDRSECFFGLPLPFMFWSMGQLFGCPPLSASEPTHSKQWPISYRLVRQSLLYWEITTNYVVVVYFVLRLWFVVGFLFWGRKYNAFTPPPRLLQQERARYFLASLRHIQQFQLLTFLGSTILSRRPSPSSGRTAARSRRPSTPLLLAMRYLCEIGI